MNERRECVRARTRVRAKEQERERIWTSYSKSNSLYQESASEAMKNEEAKRVSVCMFVCGCSRARESERDSAQKSKGKRMTSHVTK